MPNLRPTELILILAIILLLFGAKKLPALAKSIGESLKVFRKETADIDKEQSKDDAKKNQVTDAQIANTVTASTPTAPAVAAEASPATPAPTAAPAAPAANQ